MPSSNTTQVFEFLNMPICCFDARGGLAITQRLKSPNEKMKMNFFNLVPVINPVLVINPVSQFINIKFLIM